MENSTNRMSRLAKSDLFYKKIITPEEVVARIDQVTAGKSCAWPGPSSRMIF